MRQRREREHVLERPLRPGPELGQARRLVPARVRGPAELPALDRVERREHERVRPAAQRLEPELARPPEERVAERLELEQVERLEHVPAEPHVLLVVVDDLPVAAVDVPQVAAVDVPPVAAVDVPQVVVAHTAGATSKRVTASGQSFVAV
jgi:hypothetical protein